MLTSGHIVDFVDFQEMKSKSPTRNQARVWVYNSSWNTSRTWSAASSAPPAQPLVKWISRILGGNAVSESVTTRLHFKASAENVWNAIQFYEEVPGRPSWLLRAFIPYPVRAEGRKAAPGSKVRCIYIGGELLKRITTVEPLHRMEFEVLDQSLGLENCALVQSGSYNLEPSGNGIDLLLTTNYAARLHPRWLCRLVEGMLTHQLHLHILRGMKSSVSASIRQL
jgi:hypothetical protein